MSSTYENTLLDFDLNLLNHPSSNTEQQLQAKVEKLRRSVIFLKKKVLFSHSAVTKYKNARNYASILENNQVFNKEGCKQHLIEITNFIEKVSKLENDIRIAENRDREKNETIVDLQNKIEALQSLVKQLKTLLIEKSKTDINATVDKNNDKGFKDRTRKVLVQKDTETSHKETAKITSLERQNYILRKENAKIPKLEKEIENLRKDTTGIANCEQENDCKDITKIENLQKEIQALVKENSQISGLKTEVETLSKENARIPKLEKDIEGLRKENVKIKRLEREIERLHKDNSRLLKLEKELEILRKANSKIPLLEKQNKIRKEYEKVLDSEHEVDDSIKNVKIAGQELNKILFKEDIVLPSTKKEIESFLKHLISVKDNGTRSSKYNILNKYESDGNSDWSDNENYFDKALLSSTPNDIIIPKKTPIADRVAYESDNEVVSVDTGRGSSLAYSENEKCPQSPDYAQNESRPNAEKIEKGKPNKNVTTAVHMENIESQDITQRHSPVLSSDNTSVEPATILVHNDDAKKVPKLNEIKCRELGNTLQCENDPDLEIQNILSEMRLSHKAITPLPRTPLHIADDEPMSLSDHRDQIRRYMFLSKSIDELQTILKKILYKCIQECAYKSNLKVRLHPDINFLGNQYDGDHYYIKTIKHFTHLIACFEKILTTQDFPKEGSIVNSNLDILNPIFLEEDSNLGFISSQSSIQKDTDILQDKQEERRLAQTSLLKTHNENQSQLFDHCVPDDMTVVEDENHCVSDVTIDNDLSKENEVSCSQDIRETNSTHTDTATINHVKKTKSKKITKLEKFKKKVEPKYKIKKEIPPIVRKRIKPKKIIPLEKKVTANDTSASLNDKLVYEKAVKVMAEINSTKSSKITKSPVKMMPVLSPKLTTPLDKNVDSGDDNQAPQNESVITRSKRKAAELFDRCAVVLIKDPLLNISKEMKMFTAQKQSEDNEATNEPTPKRRRRSSNESVTQPKRTLRSSTVNLRLSTENNTEAANQKGDSNRKSIEESSVNKNESNITRLPVPNSPKSATLQCSKLDKIDSTPINYTDLDIFSENIHLENGTSGLVDKVNSDQSSCHPKESILCKMIEKYGTNTMRPNSKKIPDSAGKSICEKIEQEIAAIIELPASETKNAMNSFVADLRKLHYKHFITGLIKYLSKPERKIELFGKIMTPSAPAMTKAEQVLLYVISNLKSHWPSIDIVDAILSSIEYLLFKLNRTPEFDVIESTSHFFAILCRYFKAKSRLRLFILDAMYCIQFKSVPLIKQCLDVWMHIIPLAHMGIAKSPLVTCLVYLLHFYKCEDKFNRVQDIRNILSRKYFYQITDWNEKKILEMLTNYIKDLKDIPIERKMLRVSLILIAKRQGPRWCQNNLIKNVLQPMIEKEGVPNNVKEFCVSMFGPLMKPYPVDMKVHCEIAINQLTDILNNNPTPEVEEAAIISMISFSRHNQHRINQILLSRKMKPMSPELENVIRDYVKARPLKLWKKNLSRMTRC